MLTPAEAYRQLVVLHQSVQNDRVGVETLAKLKGLIAGSRQQGFGKERRQQLFKLMREMQHRRKLCSLVS